MKTPHNPSLIGRLLWSLCIMQVVVLVTAIAGTQHHIIDDQLTFMDDALIDALEDSISVAPQGLAFEFSGQRRSRQAASPDLRGVIADRNGYREQIGSVPPEFQTLATHLSILGSSQIRALPEYRRCVSRFGKYRGCAYTLWSVGWRT